MRQHVCVALIIGALAAGCSDPSPTQPTPNPGTSDGPTARLKVTVDTLGSSEAVSGLSNVTLDASESSGTGLTYRVDFGDGTTATQAVAKHVYAAAGMFTAAVTITDASGRTSTASREVAVASPVGTWLYAVYLPRARQVEVRTLALTAQDGTLRGFLAATGQPDRAVTGTLSGERGVQIVLDDGSEALEGVLPSVLSVESSRLELLARGGPADGERLEFARLRGEPSGPAPDAVLKMRFFSFGAPFAVQSFSPILFDGSTSRGEGLRYFIEFGDREFSTEASAVHPITNADCAASMIAPCHYTARLTVVDRFGRSDQEAVPLEVRSLVTRGHYVEWQGTWGSAYGGSVLFHSQDGPGIAGTIQPSYSGSAFPLRAAFTGALSGERDVRLVLTQSGIVLSGTLTLSLRLDGPYWSWLGSKLVLTQSGGPQHGQTYEFWFRNGY